MAAFHRLQEATEDALAQAQDLRLAAEHREENARDEVDELTRRAQAVIRGAELGQASRAAKRGHGPFRLFR